MSATPARRAFRCRQKLGCSERDSPTASAVIREPRPTSKFEDEHSLSDEASANFAFFFAGWRSRKHEHDLFGDLMRINVHLNIYPAGAC